MLLELGRAGHPHNIAIAPSFTPASLSPLLLLDGDAYAAPSLWQNSSSFWPSMYQSVTSTQPIINAGVVEFDGIDDYMLGGYYNYGEKTAQTLPDGAGSDAGKGITCTGLAYDVSTDTFWVANHGQALSTDPYTPSLMNVTKDGSTKISELVFTTQFPTVQSIQGVAVDTSDGTLWFASVGENLIRHVSKTGADLGSITVDVNPNGLAYDGSDDTLLVMYNNSQVKRYSASTGLFIETVVTLNSLSNVDHLYLDETNNVLWISRGINGAVSGVSAYSIDDGVLSDQIRLPDSTAIEGIYLNGETLYVANDGYFHNGTLNQIHSYPFNPAGIISTVTRSYSALEYNVVFKIGGTSVNSETIIAVGDPLTGRGFSIFLVGNTSNTIRVIINDGIAPIEQVDIICSSLLTLYSIVTIKVNFATRTVSLYQNGVFQGQGIYSVAISTAIFYEAMSIVGLPDGSRATHLDIKDICITDYLMNQTQNNNLGNYYAQEHGLSWTNM